MQEENEEKLSHAKRLKNLKVSKEWTWDKVAEALGVSPSHVFAVLDGKTGLGDVREARLAKLEKDTGIYVEQNRVTGPQEAVAGNENFEYWRRRAIQAEEKLGLLRMAFRAVLEEDPPARKTKPTKPLSPDTTSAQELLAGDEPD